MSDAAAWLKGARVGYAPYSNDFQAPGDRRRFVHYARAREIDFEIARPGERYDVLVLSARADITAWAKAPRSTQIVFDLIDSYLALPASVRGLLRGAGKFVIGEISRPVMSYRAAIERMCIRADAVVCTTEEQREDLLGLNSNVHVVLDFHMEVEHLHKTDFTTGEVIHLVWEGLPVTLGPFDTLAPVLGSLAQERPLALHLITDLRTFRYLGRILPQSTEGKVRGYPFATYLYQWNLHMLPRIVTACDIAVIPLDLDDPLSVGKPENKLLLFWRMGMPAVASASPSHQRAMAEAGVDLACPDPDSWIRRLAMLAESEDERRRAGELGRDYALDRHSEARILERWDRVLESIR